MDKELAQSIGAAAREARKALELTQEDAAEKIGVSAEFYARIERGNALPSVPTFARIAAALGVSADTLLGLPTAIPSAPLAPQQELEAPTWATASPPADSPEVRRLMRRLRKATPATLRLVNMLIKELERSISAGGNPMGSNGNGSPAGSGDD